MPTILLDTDFLSSFLKIGLCDLIRTFYRVEQVFIPSAVHRELAQTDLLEQLLSISWIESSLEIPTSDETLMQDPAFQALGSGEQACILLARTMSDAILLISDNVARQFARSLGLSVVNIPAFLLACKAANLLNPVEMARIVEDLKTRDVYEFRSEIRAQLLE